MTELYAHQQRFLERNPAKCLLCWSTGTGKTRTAIEWAQKNKEWALIIVPKALKQNWIRNRDFFQQNQIDQIGVVSMCIITKEEFRRDWRNLTKYNTVIVDEAHHFSGMKSQMAKSLTSYIKGHGIERVLLLTATPYRSSPWDIYVAARHLGYQWNYYKFLDKFFWEVPMGRKIMLANGKMKQRMIMKVKPGMEDDVAELVARIGDVVRLEDCADIPEQTFEMETFEMTEEQTKAYSETWDVNPAVRYVKRHQVESGVLKGDEYSEDKFFPSNKTERIVDLCTENKKIIIVCRYKLQIQMLKERLAELGRPVYVISGDTTGEKRDEIVRGADSSKEAIVLIQAACSEGYELPSFPLMVFASMDFSYVNYKQMCGRILRLNKLKKNVYLHLVSGAVDTAVYNAIMKKQDFNTAIYEREELERKRLSECV